MKYDWETYKWIFEPDGSLRDIYVNDTDLGDWKMVIRFLNKNHVVKYGVTGEHEVSDRINEDYVLSLLADEIGEWN